MFAMSLTDEQAMEIASVYDKWEVGKAYGVNTLVTYGENGVGDPQLYRVVQAHTSQADWTPDATASLYTPIGLTEEGYTEWSKPTGAHDAYNKGDIVCYDDVLWVSEVDGNVWQPGLSGWAVYE